MMPSSGSARANRRRDDSDDDLARLRCDDDLVRLNYNNHHNDDTTGVGGYLIIADTCSPATQSWSVGKGQELQPPQEIICIAYGT